MSSGLFCVLTMVNPPSLASGPLHLLFPLPGTAFSSLPIPPRPWGFCLDVASSRKPSSTRPPFPNSARVGGPSRVSPEGLAFPVRAEPLPQHSQLLLVFAPLSRFSWGQVYPVHKYSLSGEHPLGTGISRGIVFFFF